MLSIRKILNRRRRYDDLSVSMEEHIAEKVEELVEGGMPRREAEQRARREFGNVALIEQRSREVWQWQVVESAWADAKFAVRQLIKSPGFTVTAVVTLALGIAVNATMFSLVDAFLLPHLPGHDAESVVVVSSVNPDQSFLPDTSPVSAPNYFSWRADTHLFADMSAADGYRTGSLASGGTAEALSYAAVTPNYFALLGASAQLGRTFVQSEDQEGRNRVVILSHGLWERRFGSDPSVVGRTVRLNREDYTVVGVMGADFRLLGFIPELWTPLVLSAADHAPGARSSRELLLFARLAPGVTLSQAKAQMNAVAEQAQHDFPATEQRWGVAVRTLPDFLVYDFGIRNALAILMTVVTMVLLIACANVAGLLLTRAVGRQQEMGIRMSLGATRARVVRQLLTEGLVIGLLGGGAGLLLTWAGIRVVRAGMTFNEAVHAVPIRLDTNVLVFAIVLSLASALLASMAPALKASRSGITADLNSESRTASGSRSQGWLRSFLVGGEITLAFVLLTGSGLLIRGVYVLEHQPLGFRHDHLLTAGLTLDRARYQDPARQIQFVRAILPALRQLPGVESAAVTSDLPSTGPGSVPIHIKGQPDAPGNAVHTTTNVVVTPDYFEATGVPLVRGRLFTDGDNGDAPRVVVVNQEFVHRYLQDRDAEGRQIQLDVSGNPPLEQGPVRGDPGAAPQWATIVGVVRDVKSFSEDPRIEPEVYEPYWQRPVASLSLMIRTNVEPNSLIPQLRNLVAGVDPELPLLRVMSMDGVIDTQRNGNTLFTGLLATFALLALTLACIGIYGLISYSVGQRTHEIGIRVALGADTSAISRMVMRQGLKVAGVGSVIGLVLALPLPKVFDSIFMGLLFSAPGVYPVVLVAMFFVALLATYGPARRASRVNPAAALRNE
jgi:putative ABC transport system permease protein